MIVGDEEAVKKNTGMMRSNKREVWEIAGYDLLSPRWIPNQQKP